MKTILAVFAIVIMAGAAGAGTITTLPNFVGGPIAGNDNAVVVSAIVGHTVELVGKFEDVSTPLFPLAFAATGIAGNLTIEIFDDPLAAFALASSHVKGSVSGTNWDYLAVKAGPEFYLFERTGDLTLFDLPGHCLSHASLYRAVPEPSAAAHALAFIVGVGLVYSVTRRRRQR